MEENINNSNNSVPQNPLPVQQAAPSPEKVQKHISPFTIIKRIIYGIVSFVCLLGLWSTISTYLPSFNKTGTGVSSTNVPKAAVTWKTITEKKYNFSIKYPDDLEMSQETPYSTAFQKKDRMHIGFPLLYISVIPDGFTKKEDIYNFMPAGDINGFFALQDNATMQTITGDNAQYFTYKRLASIPVAGIQGIMIENTHVWQGEDGVINRRVLVKKNGFTYLIGSYYYTQQDLDIFHNFLLSFSFLN